MLFERLRGEQQVRARPDLARTMESNPLIKITWDYGKPDQIKRGGFGMVAIYYSHKLAIKTIPENATVAEARREVLSALVMYSMC